MGFLADIGQHYRVWELSKQAATIILGLQRRCFLLSRSMKGNASGISSLSRDTARLIARDIMVRFRYLTCQYDWPLPDDEGTFRQFASLYLRGNGNPCVAIGSLWAEKSGSRLTDADLRAIQRLSSIPRGVTMMLLPRFISLLSRVRLRTEVERFIQNFLELEQVPERLGNVRNGSYQGEPDDDTEGARSARTGAGAFMVGPLEHHHGDVSAAVEEALCEIVNGPWSRMQETIPAYLVRGLVRETRFDTDEERGRIAERCDAALRVADRFRDPAPFFAFLHRAVSKYLLGNFSGGDHPAESFFIDRLQAHFQEPQGSAWASLTGCWLDWKRASANRPLLTVTNNGNPIEISVMALNRTWWPTLKPMPAPVLPQELRACIQFYEEWHQRSNPALGPLQWRHGHGKVTVTMTDQDHQVDLLVTPIQACVLLLFNERSSWGLETLLKKLYPDAGMCCMKTRSVLTNALEALCAPRGVLSQRGGVYEWHSIRHSDRQKAELSFERYAKGPASHYLKKWYIDVLEACVVRVMKRRRQCTLTQLSQFMGEDHLYKGAWQKPSHVARIVTGLIQREYLRYQDANPDVLEYIA